MKTILLFLIAALLLSCVGTSKQTSVLSVATPLPAGTQVEVIGTGQNVPSGAKLLGHVKIGDSGFSTNCTYDKVLSDAQKQARGMGGNLLQIKKHTEPNVWSTCHRIEGDVYLVK